MVAHFEEYNSKAVDVHFLRNQQNHKTDQVRDRQITELS